jgi:hypothetical protein
MQYVVKCRRVREVGHPPGIELGDLAGLVVQVGMESEQCGSAKIRARDRIQAVIIAYDAGLVTPRG